MMALPEEAVTFGAHARLVGVLSPVARRHDGPAIILLNAGLLHHVGPQRMNVQIARMFASVGVPCLRFDCSGIGDSGPREDHLPFAESSVLETIEAMDFVAERTGAESFVLLGLCSGADQAFQVALADERVAGAVLLEPYPFETLGFKAVRVLSPLRRAATWKKALTGQYNVAYKVLKRLAGETEAAVDATLLVRDIPERTEAERGYHTLLDRGASLYVVFTAGQQGTFNHEGQFWKMHPSLPRDEPKLRYTYFGAADHTFSLAAVRGLLLEHIARWYTDRFGATPVSFR